MKLTKNEAKKHMSELANRYYTDNFYTKEQYNADCDAIEILPLDLAKYDLDPETEKWINILFDEEDTDRNGEYMLRGFTRNEGMEMQKLGLTYGEYANAYSFYAYNDDQMLIYSYCEGDTTLQIFSNKEKYEIEKQSQYDWYKKERCA